MGNKRFQEFCQMGSAADQLLMQGHYADAERAYQSLLSEFENQKAEVNSYILAKTTLGALICSIKSGQFEKAFGIWTASAEESLQGIGVYALENAQTSIDDMITYDMVCAFLHSISQQPREHSARAINQYISRVASHALEQGDAKLFALALNNWKLHLREVFQGSIPHEFATPLIRFEKKSTEPIRPQAVGFPPLTEWQKPEPFREMSRIARSDIPAGKRRVG